MSQQTNGAAPPSTARHLSTPVALALGDLAAIFDDLQFVLRGCERLLVELERGAERDDLLVESLWTATLSSYARCFRSGARGMGLSVADLGATELKGEVVQWHSLLGKLRDFYVEKNANPREAFSVGVAQGEDGKPDGIVITSVGQPAVDENTIRQTGRLTFELSKLVDKRIKEHQRNVFTSIEKLTTEELDKLPPIELALPETTPPTAG